MDNTAPTVTSFLREIPLFEVTNLDSLTWVVMFSEAVQNVDQTDFTVSGTGIGSPTLTVLVDSDTGGLAYDVTASGGNLSSLDGRVTLGFDARQDITDAAGNALSNTTPPADFITEDSYTMDNTAPMVTSISRRSTNDSGMTNADSLVWRVAFSEAVTNVGAADFTVSGTGIGSPTLTVAVVSDTGHTTYDVTASGGNLSSLDGRVTLSFDSDQDITDVAGNALSNTTPPADANENSYTVDNTAPTVEISGVSGMITGTVTATVTFSEVVKNFVAGDIVVTGATASGFTATTAGRIWTVELSPSQHGTPVTVNVAANVASDAASNGNESATEVRAEYSVIVTPIPLTVSLAAEQSAITEANGRTKFTISLSRALAAGETATVPFTVTGGDVNDHWNIKASGKSIGPGVERIGSGAKAAVKFSEGSQTATLTLIGRPDSDRVDRPITIAFGEGKRVPRTNVEGGIMPVGGPLEVIIVDSVELTVSLAAEQSAITEANGRTKFTISLSRALAAGETATVPFTVTGGDVNDHWNIKASGKSIGPGVERIGSGAKAAVKFSEGSQTATLTLIGRPDSDRVDRPITIAFGEGKRVPRTNVEGGIMPVGGPLEVIIVDSDEAALWVDNAMAKEDQGLMRFNVRLSAPLQETASVYYQTRESHPVSARQGQDYLSRSGRLDFQPGQTRRQVRIKIHDDAHDEGAETFQLVLSSPRGARIADAVGVATIVNTDVMPAAWLSRLGRTVSQQVVDALQDRFAALPSSPGLTLTVAGEELSSAVPLAENQQVLSKALGFETVTGQQLVEGSSFSFSPTADAPAQFTLWGRGALSSFSGAEDSVSLEGDVSTALVGAEWSTARWRAGAALSHSWGSGSYGRGGDNSGDGDVSATLAGLFPYGRYGLTPRLGIWAVAGYGWGELSLEPDGAGAEYKPGVNLGMAAVGMDGLLLDGGAAGLSLTTTADVLTLKTTSEEVDGLASSESAISRLRLGLEATRPFPLANGASLLPSLEVGIRQDGGDAETGFGMEIGAGMGWSDPERGINAEMKGRTLLTHVEEEFQEQGLALSFAWDPTPSNRGPSFSLNHAVGAVVEGGMEALLRPTVMEPLDDTPRSPWQQQLETRFAYGFPVFGDRLTLTPALALALSSSSRTYGLLWSVAPHAQQAQGKPWEVALEGERQEHASSSFPTDHSLKLRFSLLF